MYIIRRMIEMEKEMSFVNNWYFFIIEFLTREFYCYVLIYALKFLSSTFRIVVIIWFNELLVPQTKEMHTHSTDIW